MEKTIELCNLVETSQAETALLLRKSEERAYAVNEACMKIIDILLMQIDETRVAREDHSVQRELLMKEIHDLRDDRDGARKRYVEDVQKIAVSVVNLKEYLSGKFDTVEAMVNRAHPGITNNIMK